MTSYVAEFLSYITSKINIVYLTLRMFWGFFLDSIKTIPFVFYHLPKGIRFVALCVCIMLSNRVLCLHQTGLFTPSKGTTGTMFTHTFHKVESRHFAISKNSVVESRETKISLACKKRLVYVYFLHMINLDSPLTYIRSMDLHVVKHVLMTEKHMLILVKWSVVPMTTKWQVCWGEYRENEQQILCCGVEPILA